MGSLLVALTMMLVTRSPSASLWAAGGGALTRFLSGDRTRRVVSLALAALVLATVAYVWV